ncbi:MAG: hypothetical protein A2033_03700 [Bacteroidetes bacterium GWA2_31_9]|nr:MAG: hypothetical protein A2033_03700 [Bacteroidetes bacterium GWA2_31_9]
MKLILFLIFIIVIVLKSQAQWTIPADASQKINNVEITPKSLTVGKSIFNKMCQSCHGKKADGMGLMKSASLIADSLQLQKDGVIFYKIATGKDQMPPFQSILKEEEIWAVINYLRILVNPDSVPPAKNVKLILSGTGKGNQRKVTAMVMEKGDSAYIMQPDVDIHFYIKREFGLMRFGNDYNYTGSSGKVSAMFPTGIIGDKEGVVTIYAKIEDSFMFTETTDSIVQKWGKPIVVNNEAFDERSLWASRDKAPVWLLLVANGIILFVWLFIILVIVNIFRIKKLSKLFIK